MFEYLYEWIRNIAFYMILVMVVIQILPDSSYKKYVRFFTGLVLILLMATPVLKIFGMDTSISELYQNESYENEIQKIEDATNYLHNIDAAGYLGEEESEEEENSIGVEEIKIGR